jgi:hypothetical protein
MGLSHLGLYVCDAIPHKTYFCDERSFSTGGRFQRRTCISPANSAELSLNAAKNVEANVRSELIFRARETVDNKYKLCQTVSKATRRLHIAATNTTDTINDALSRIAGGDDSSIPANPILASS